MGQNQVKYRIEKSHNQSLVRTWDKTKLGSELRNPITKA